jgi:hypothetical protein
LNGIIEGPLPFLEFRRKNGACNLENLDAVIACCVELEAAPCCVRGGRERKVDNTIARMKCEDERGDGERFSSLEAKLCGFEVEAQQSQRR